MTIRKDREQTKKVRADEANTDRLCIRFPTDLSDIQKKLAAKMSITHTQLLICISLLIPYHSDKEIITKLKNLKTKSGMILNHKNPKEGVFYDLRTGKWAVVVKYRPQDKKCFITHGRYETLVDAKRVLDNRKYEKEQVNIVEERAKRKAELERLEDLGQLNTNKISELYEIINAEGDDFINYDADKID
jgi:hypothetical protein